MTIINSEEKTSRNLLGWLARHYRKLWFLRWKIWKKRLRLELASKKDLKNLEMKVDSLDKKFDASQDRHDRHDERIGKLEDIHSHYKYSVRVWFPRYLKFVCTS